MSRASKLAPHHELIVQARRDKVPEKEIATMIGATRSAVAAYCQRNNIPYPHESKPVLALPIGTISVWRNFTKAQIEHMERQAIAGGFETIAEYIVECARDKLEEEMT